MKKLDFKIYFGILLAFAFLKPVQTFGETFSPLRYSYSFHSIMTSPKPSRIKEKFGQKCAQAISDVLRKKGNFSTTAMRENILRVSEIPTMKGRTFYHYTDAEVMIAYTDVKVCAKAHVKTAKGQGSVLFDFIRANQPNYYFYAAANPTSSKSYGKIQIRPVIPPDVKVYHPYGLKDAAGYGTIRDKIENELIAKYPQLEACRSTGETWQSILEDLSAEAEGVGIKAYMGVTAEQNGLEWYMIYGEWGYKELKFGQREWGEYWYLNLNR